MNLERRELSGASGKSKGTVMNVVRRRDAGSSPAPVRAASTAGILALSFASLVTVGTGAAHADTVTDESITIDFSSAGYDPAALLAPGGQNGWKFSDPNLDVELLEDAIRFSNAATSSAFSNQLFAPSLARSAGAPESGAELDRFTAEFTIAAVDDEYQEGLRLEVSPDDGAGSRTGGSIVFHHTDGALEIGAIWAELGQGVSVAEDYFSAVLASVDPTVAHDIKLVHTFREGAQDTVDVSVDGALVGTVGTLEEYHLKATDERRTISTLFFRAAQGLPSVTGRGWGLQPPVPELEGEGFLLSDIAYGVSKASDAAEPVQVTSGDLGATNYERSAAWTTAHGAFPGEYNFVLDATKGAALELVTEGGVESTQSRLLHYVDSGAYPGVDGAAVKLPGHDLKTVPLTSVTHSPIRVTYSGESYVSVQMEIWYGWDVTANDGEGGPYYSTLYRGVPGTGDWTSANLAPTDSWITSRALVRTDGTTFLVASGSASLLDIAAGLSTQQPRVMSFGLNKGRDSSPTQVGAVRVSELEVLGQTFVFHAAVPSAPATPVATLDGIDSVVVTWTAPNPGTSPVTGYVVTIESDSGATRTAPAAADATSHAFTRLAPGTYTVKVVAANALGSSSDSVASAPVVVPSLDVPTAPARPAVTAVGDDGVQVTWSAPADGGTALTGYTVALTSSTGSLRSASVDASASSHTFTGLPAGSYTATVVASSAVGSSAASVASAAITVKSVVTIYKPVFSKKSQIRGSKSVATVSAVVIGAEGKKVGFYNGSTLLGTATVTGAVATLKLSRSLEIRGYGSVVAKFAGDTASLAATSPKAAKFTVTKPRPAKAITVTGKAFKKNAKPKVTVRVGKLDNGAWATGKVQVRVNGKLVKTVSLKARHKGKITVTLPRAKKAITVKAGLKTSSTVKGTWSKAAKVRVK